MTISGMGMSFRGPSSLVKSLDTDRSGGLSKVELEKAKAPPGAPSAEELLAKGDSDGNEELSMDELTELFAELKPPAGGPPPGGAPPPGGSPPAGGANLSTDSTSAADPADTNEDGTVSEQERLAYAMKKAAATYAQAARGPSGGGVQITA
jgi:hypothetical protein